MVLVSNCGEDVIEGAEASDRPRILFRSPPGWSDVELIVVPDTLRTAIVARSQKIILRVIYVQLIWTDTDDRTWLED